MEPSRRLDEGWYQELDLQFHDGSKQQFFLHVTRSGRHVPVKPQPPADWTRLDFHQCPGCSLVSAINRCPVALSMESTLAKLKNHRSTEIVRVTAIDGANRTVAVTWPLQNVGVVFVQLAVFASGCPVGDQVRPCLKDLRPFSTMSELTHHVVNKIMLRYRGDIEASKKEVRTIMAPLRQVFLCLLERLRALNEDKYGDAISNSIVALDAFSVCLPMQIDRICDQVAMEMGWTPRSKRIAPDVGPGWWTKLKNVFS